MAKQSKITLQKVLAAMVLTMGCIMVVVGFLVPPQGEIHDSVLVAFGEALTYSGSVFGIRTHYKYKHSVGKVGENEDE